MTSLERMRAAIAGEPTDRTPLWPFCMAFSAKYAGVPYSQYAQDHKKLVDAQVRVADDFALDAVTIDTDAYREASALGAKLIFPENDLPQVEQPAIVRSGSFTFRMPDVSTAPRLVDKVEGVRLCKQHYGGEKAVCGWIESPFQSAGTLYDLNRFMMGLNKEKAFINELMDFTLELGIRFAAAQIEAGADIIGVGDAMASMISAKMYRELVLPHTKKLVAALQGRGAKLKYHICGAATHILPFAVEAGFDIVNIDHKVDLAGAFAATGGTICIKGNIDPVTLLLRGSADEVEATCLNALETAGSRFILSPGCELPRDTPPQNLRAMAAAVRAFADR